MSQTASSPPVAELPDSSPETRETDLKPTADSTSTTLSRSVLQRLVSVVRIIPTVFVLAVLAGVGYWGHHSDWSMPKFSDVIGAEEKEKDDWCAEHGVPESICVACNAELMPKGELHGWCAEHGVHECPFHHPQVAQLEKAPTIERRDLERAARALKLRNRKENNSNCKLHLRRIQFASKKDADKAGIDIGLVDRKKIVETIPASGEITYDQTRVTRLSTRTAGTAWRVYRNVGDTVRRGDILAVVNASEVGQQKAELLAAVVDFDLKKVQRDQLKRVAAGGGVAERVLQEAQAALTAADIRVQKGVQSLVNLGFPLTTGQVLKQDRRQLARQLRFLGLPKEIVRYLDPENTTSNLIPVRASASGVVVSRDVVAGEVIDMNKVLFTVVDTSRMWLMLNVAMENARFLKIGRKVQFRPDGSDVEVTAPISWISTKADPQTRMVKVRVELANERGTLRDETFGTGKIVLREEPGAIVVPNEAVHWEGCCHVVFVP